MNSKRDTPKHIIIKIQKIKIKRESLKQQEKQLVMYKGAPKRPSADFPAETLQARREWQDIFKEIKGKNLQQRIFYLAKLLFKTEGEIKSFTDK